MAKKRRPKETERETRIHVIDQIEKFAKSLRKKNVEIYMEHLEVVIKLLKNC